MTDNTEEWQDGYDEGYDEGYERGCEDSAWEEVALNENILTEEEVTELNKVLDRLFEVFNIQIDFTDSKQQDVCKELYDYLGYVAPGMKV